MNMTRRLSALALALLAAASMLACGKDDTPPPAMDPDNPTLVSGEERITADPFVYTTEDLTPYVTLGNYRGLTATRGATTMSDAEFQAQIDYMLNYYAEATPITDRAAAEGDTVNFDFAGYIDGVQFDGGTATGQTITLSGNGGFIEGFVPAIIGKMPGAEFDIVTTFPTDYGVDSLNGKEATFKCKLNYIEGEKIVPAFDDAFAQKYSDFKTAAEMEADLRQKLDADKAAQAENQLYADIWAQVVANATVHKYPEEKVTFVYQQYVLQFTSYAAMAYKATYEEYIAMMNMTDDEVRQMARDQVKDDLVFYALVKAENVAITDAEYEAGLPEYAEAMGMDVDALLEQYGEAVIRDGILWNKTQDLLMSWATIS